METSTIVILVLLAVVIGYAILIYNNLVSLKHAVSQAWANIDVLLKRRHDELPKLVETCKQYMKHERETLTRIFHPLLAFPGGQWMEDVVPRTGRGKAREGLFSRLQAHLPLTPIVCQRAGAALTGGYPGTSRSATVQNRR